MAHVTTVTPESVMTLVEDNLCEDFAHCACGKPIWQGLYFCGSAWRMVPVCKYCACDAIVALGAALRREE